MNYRWQRWPYFVLGVSSLLTLVFLLYPDFVCRDLDSGTAPHLLRWLRGLATTALFSTLLWSIVAFIGIYFGPHGLIKHSEALGPSVMMFANGSVGLAIISCGIGIYAVWQLDVHEHLFCVIFAEGLFWLFDFMLIRRLMVLEKCAEGEKWTGSDAQWASDVRQQLEAWLQYVDRPATIAFVVLLGAVYYLDWKDVFISQLEIETLASGAVFFASMTANLAFFAANLPMAHGALEE